MWSCELAEQVIFVVSAHTCTVHSRTQGRTDIDECTAALHAARRACRVHVKVADTRAVVDVPAWRRAAAAAAHVVLAEVAGRQGWAIAVDAAHLIHAGTTVLAHDSRVVADVGATGAVARVPGIALAREAASRVAASRVDAAVVRTVPNSHSFTSEHGDPALPGAHAHAKPPSVMLHSSAAGVHVPVPSEYSYVHQA